MSLWRLRTTVAPRARTSSTELRRASRAPRAAREARGAVGDARGPPRPPRPAGAPRALGGPGLTQLVQPALGPRALEQRSGARPADRVAAAKAGQAPRLRERAKDQQP